MGNCASFWKPNGYCRTKMARVRKKYIMEISDMNVYSVFPMVPIWIMCIQMCNKLLHLDEIKVRRYKESREKIFKGTAFLFYKICSLTKLGSWARNLNSLRASGRKSGRIYETKCARVVQACGRVLFIDYFVALLTVGILKIVVHDPRKIIKFWKI